MKWLTKSIALAIIVALSWTIIAGCGSTNGTAAKSAAAKTEASVTAKQSADDTAIGTAKSYEVGQEFVVNGLTFTVEKAERAKSIRNKLGGASYTPRNGMFLIVYYKFKGVSGGEKGGYDTASIKVEDSKGQYYDDLNGEDGLTDLAMQKKMQMLGFALIDDPEEKEFIDLYDVPDQDQGLKLTWLKLVSISPLKLGKLAEVKIKDLQDVTGTITIGKAREWYDTALAEAKKWQSDAKLMELHADNTSAAFRMVEDKDEKTAGLKEVPMNGATETWKYYFMSQNAEVPYMVVMTQGTLVQSKEATMFLTNKYMDLKPDSDWKIDSPEAFELTKTKVTQDISQGAIVTYSLFNGGNLEKVNGQLTQVFRLRWEIKVETIKGAYTTVEIDATTGDVLSAKTM